MLWSLHTSTYPLCSSGFASLVSWRAHSGRVLGPFEFCVPYQSMSLPEAPALLTLSAHRTLALGRILLDPLHDAMLSHHISFIPQPTSPAHHMEVVAAFA